MLNKLFVCLIASLLSAAAQAGVKIEHWQTSTGARVFFVETHALPILDVQVDFAAGSMFDQPGKSGVAALTRSILDLGAGDLDENQLADQLADIGAHLGGAADTDRAGVSIRTLSAKDKRELALALLAKVLHAPRFEPAIFAREQARTMAALKDAMTRPDAIAGKAFWKAMYPDHPYGRQATPESVGGLTVDDLKAHYQMYYSAANATITLVGDATPEQAREIAEQLAAGLPAHGGVPPLPPEPATGKGGQVKVPHPASQSHIYIGLPAIERGNPDFFPLLVGNYTLGGGGFVSRLMKEVRDQRGYAYSVYSYLAPMKQRGPFQIGLQTKRAQAQDAIKVVREVLGAFLKDGPTEEELAAAKANLTGSFPLRLDSNKKILDNVAMIAFFGLPLDYLDHYQARVQAVTVDQIKQAFSRHVQADRLMTVTVAAD